MATAPATQYSILVLRRCASCASCSACAAAAAAPPRCFFFLLRRSSPELFERSDAGRSCAPRPPSA